jgi:hypothetical protein
MTWMSEHWGTSTIVFSVVAVVASTIATRWIDWYGADHPRVVRALRFLLSLLSLLPAPGSASRGLVVRLPGCAVQVPGLSYSAKPLFAAASTRELLERRAKEVAK